MLVDPLPVKSLSLVAHTAITVAETTNFAVTDVSPGRSVRRGFIGSFDATTPCDLIIAHSVSNENKPAKTDRTLVRLDVKLFTSAGQPVIASAYLVVAIPQGAFVTSASDANPFRSSVEGLEMIQTLLGAIGVSPTAATLSDTNLLRILAGEP